MRLTDREIIDMAREAGHPFPPSDIGFLERFAGLVATAEREACAKVCYELEILSAVWGNRDQMVGAQKCFDAIKERKGDA